MDSKTFAKKLSNLVILVPPIAYASLLYQSPNFLELVVASFIFFALIPYKLMENFQKMPRNPKTKLQAVGEFLLSFAAGFAALWYFNAPNTVLAFSASLVAAHVIAYAVTPYWMISTHSMMSMQPLTVLALQGRVEAWPVLVIFLVFGWARITLKAHTPMQYLAGGVVGSALTAIALASLTTY
ncbi:MAG: hypothetical protein NTY90_05140 [Candidatus Micrarchaeota archaeon]|nr:hypothetical protein [Candidatus Micrarchaeota archaeon]